MREIRDLAARWDASFPEPTRRYNGKVYGATGCGQGRYPDDPARVRKGDAWLDPIALVPALQVHRRIMRMRGIIPQEPREYLTKPKK